MESSKPPKDVLGLGKHLVRELGLEDRADTLGRWMAHHLAELINEAENGATAAKRSSAGQKATETILKIWEHRLSLPGEAYPLTPYKDVLKVLERLRPDDNPYKYFGHRLDDKKDELASVLFDYFTRLILALLLMKTRPIEEKSRVEPVAIEELSDEEKFVWKAIHEWASIFGPPQKKSNRKRKSKKANDDSEISLNQSAIRLIDGIKSTLVELRKELKRTDH